MRALKRKRVITIETWERTMVRRSSIDPPGRWCPRCSCTVETATPEQTAVLICATPREVYRRIESGELHFIETTGSEVIICLRSER